MRLRRHGWVWWSVWLLVGLGVLGAAIAAQPVYRIALAGSGFKAHTLCSGVFGSRRPLAPVVAEDLGGERYRLLRFFDHTVDWDARRVTVSVLGLARQVAIYRQGLGCTLLRGTTETALRAQAGKPLPPIEIPADALWPEGKRVDLSALAPEVDRGRLAAAVDDAFSEPDANNLRRTRALVVVHRGRIVAERYAEGFDAQMPLLGWSMSKTVLNALTGILVRQGKLAVSQANLRAEWGGEGDPRAAITLDNLLHMSSGLAFSEDYDSALSDVIQMLFATGDEAHFAAAKPLEHAPGARWSYSSGTSLIVAGVLAQAFPTSRVYFRFAHEVLFAPLGMSTAMFAPDAAGTFVGSSLLYASARDWARLGLLFLRDGVWNGRRILPQGWVAYSLKPATHAPAAQYGVHIWLKLPRAAGGDAVSMPLDAYYMLGHDGQIVAVVPSHELVIVRLGLTRHPSAWDHATRLAPIVAAFPAVE